MGLDLWNFQNAKSLKNKIAELPNSILKEQAELLTKKTDDVIYGKIINGKFKPSDEDVEYTLATTFEIVVPALGNYSYTLLIVYSKPEKDYPVAITVGSNLIDDAMDFEPRYTCKNQDEFINALKDILSSEEINRDIEILFSKANIF
jgi:hypothetical protein